MLSGAAEVTETNIEDTVGKGGKVREELEV